MARLGKILLDGAALTLVGVALCAAVAGYVRNIPDPAPAVAEQAVTWDDPVTTGSIVPAFGPPAVDAAPGREGEEAVETARAWIDPPRRRPRASGRDHG